MFMPLSRLKRLSSDARLVLHLLHARPAGEGGRDDLVLLGSLSLTRKDSCIWSGVSEPASGESPNCSL